jgi:flagellar biosynthesis chaperone FliJ
MPINSGSSLQSQGEVRTRADLETLIRTRDELTSQLQRTNEERGQIAQQRLNAEARANSSSDPGLDRRLMREYEQQISELGTRTTQLRRREASARKRRVARR